MFPTLLHNINVCFSVSSVQRNQQTCLVNTNIHLSIWCNTILILNSITTDVKEIAGFGQLSTQRIDLVCGRKLRTLDHISRELHSNVSRWQWKIHQSFQIIKQILGFESKNQELQREVFVFLKVSLHPNFQ